MNHEEFAQSLSALAPEDMGRWRATLSPEAVAHAASCADCEGLANALALASEDDDALVAAPPDGYWEQFDEELASRLPESARPRERRHDGWRNWAALAAGMLLVVALRAIPGFQGGESSAPESEGSVVVIDAPAADDELATVLAAFVELPGGLWSFESDEGLESDGWSDAEGDAFDSVSEMSEMSEMSDVSDVSDVSDAQAATIIELLRAEMAS